MNCKTIQRRLLALPNPDRVSATVRNHLADCPKCREMQRRLAQIERHVPLIQVPSSSFAKAALARRVRNGPTFREKILRNVEALPAMAQRLGRPRFAAAGLAAALLLMVVGWHLSQRTGQPENAELPNHSAKPDLLLTNLIKHELALAEAHNPRPQVETLASLAEDLHGSAQVLVLAPEGKSVTRDVADWYGQVLRTVARRSEALEPADRKPVLGPLAQRLGEAAKKADDLARELDAPANHPLRGMAKAARDAKAQIEKVAQQEARLAPVGGGRAPFACILAYGPGLVLFGSAQPTPSVEQAPVPAEEARRFHRNFDLIESVVKNSMQLAVEEDPIRRAACCGNVARSLARAIEQASAEREGERAAELGQHLRAQLQRGVATNLTVAAEQTPVGSLREGELLKVAGDVARIVQPLEESLRRAAESGAGEQVQNTLRAVHDGRDGLKKALEGRDVQP